MKAETGFSVAIIGIWLVYAFLCIGMFAGVVWAALHFIKKFW